MTQIMIDIDNAVMNVYRAEAERRGIASGQAFIAALLADWPAILAPVHVDDVTPMIPTISTRRMWFVSDDKLLADDAQDHPFGGSF